MDFPKVGKLFKSPVALIVGLVLGLLILYATSRGKSGGTTADLTAASMASSASTNVALAGLTTDYNKAALSYQLGLAQTAADSHAIDVNAATTVDMQSISMLDNIVQAAGLVNLTREQSRATVNLAATNNEAMLAYAGIQADTLLKSKTIDADLTRYLDEFDNANRLQLANINMTAANTLADISAGTSRTLSNDQVRTAKVNVVGKLLGGLF